MLNYENNWIASLDTIYLLTLLAWTLQQKIIISKICSLSKYIRKFLLNFNDSNLQNFPDNDKGIRCLCQHFESTANQTFKPLSVNILLSLTASLDSDPLRNIHNRYQEIWKSLRRENYLSDLPRKHFFFPVMPQWLWS